MSKALEKAREQYRAGQHKKAADTLWEVSFGSDDGEAEARGVLELASLLRDASTGGVRTECEEHIARAERLLNAEDQALAASRPGRLATELAKDPIQLARWARNAGLTWLEIESREDVVAADMRAAVATASEGQDQPPRRCFIDGVEAEGWRLEDVTCLFKPTKLQTSPLRGADFIMGGDIVEGEERYLYLFRRVDGASG